MTSTAEQLVHNVALCSCGFHMNAGIASANSTSSAWQLPAGLLAARAAGGSQCALREGYDMQVQLLQTCMAYTIDLPLSSRRPWQCTHMDTTANGIWPWPWAVLGGRLSDAVLACTLCTEALNLLRTSCRLRSIGFKAKDGARATVR